MDAKLTKEPWWKSAVIYQIYPKSFQDSNGDGCGDLKGITNRLPYLQDLGVNAIWICPFYPSPMHDNGYDVADYYGIDPMFGNMEDMEELLQEAKKLDIRVMIDMVLNHTSEEHHWFQEALADPDSPYRSYYIFRQSDTVPSNIRSQFGGSVWEKTKDGSYYYHTFDKTQPDLNWENPKLRQEIYQMMNWWLDKGISGFRMDAITFMKKNTAFPNGIPNGADGLADSAFMSLNQPGIDDLLSELRRETYGRHGAVTVAEAPGVSQEDIGKYIGEEGHFSMIFDFSYTDLDLIPGGSWYQKSGWQVSDLKQALFHSQESTQEAGWGAVYLENHDQPRSIDKYFQEKATRENHDLQAKALATLYFLLRGTPFIYQGEELGMTNCPFDHPEEFDDVNTIDQYQRAIQAGYSSKEALTIANDRSRDNSRTPMQWDDSAYGGFSSKEPWLKCNPNYTSYHAKQQTADPKSVYSYYKNLIALRQSEQWGELLIQGRFEGIQTEEPDVVAYQRILGNQQILVAVNMSDKIVKFPIDKMACLMHNYDKISISEMTTLRPYEALVLGGKISESENGKEIAMKNQIMLITYGDSLGKDFKEMEEIVDTYYQGAIGSVHILPFFPSSGDRGFAPMCYDKVDPAFGDFEDLRRIGAKYDLMYDFMVNHISAQSEYFQDFLKNKESSPYHDLFIRYQNFWENGEPTQEQVDKIYKRKPKAPCIEAEFADGTKEKVWCTFSEEQIDLDVTSDTTKQFIRDNLVNMCENGAKIIRLDAFAYAVKQADSSCFFVEPKMWNLLSDIEEIVKPYGVEILPEIHEHYSIQMKIAEKGFWVYDFALPMLVLHALYTHRGDRLKHWLDICPRKQMTTLDTHDGIGVVDVVDLLTPEEIDEAKELLYAKGANVKKKYSSEEYNNLDIYQINCSYYSALGNDDDAYLMARAIQFFAPGIPQVYYVGMLAGENDLDLLERTKEGRNINRHYYTKEEIQNEFETRPIVARLRDLMRYRSNNPAFDGDITCDLINDHTLKITRTSQTNQAELIADLQTYQITIDGKAF